MLTPTPQTLYAILLQAVKDMAYRDGLTVNAFALVDRVPDLTHPTYGYQYEDYTDGNFWSRRWASEGAASSAMIGQWPLLMPELVNTRIVKWGGTVEHTVDLILVDHLMGTCGLRSGPAVYAAVLDMLVAVVNEVMRYRLYDAGELGPVWTVPERAAAEWDDLDNYLNEHLRAGNNVRPWGDYADLRGAMMDLTLTECLIPAGTAFRYDRPEPDALGVITCSGPC